MSKAKRTWIVMKKDGSSFINTDSTFTGRSPLQAASKVARQGLKTIYIRETGTDKIREYKGSIQSKVLESDTPFKKKGQTVKIGKAVYQGVHSMK